MLPKAVLFDLDDTILTEEKAGDIAWEHICELSARETGLYNGKVFYSLVNEIRHAFWDDPVQRSKGVEDIFQARMIIVRKALSKLNCDDEQLAGSIVRRYADLKMEATAFMPGAETTIKQLRRKGIKLAILTNGEGKEQRARIEKFGLFKLVNTCFIGGELGFGKPDPRVYEMALAQLNVKKWEAWMVGDSLGTDILGAQNLGIYSVWHDYEKKGLPQNSKIVPDNIINDITELLAI